MYMYMLNIDTPMNPKYEYVHGTRKGPNNDIICSDGDTCGSVLGIHDYCI